MIVHEECGCKHDHIQWIEMCGPCRKQSDEVRARWEEQRKNPIVPLIFRKNGVIQNVLPQTDQIQPEKLFEACL